MTHKYLLLNKPFEVLSQFTNEGQSEKSTLKDFVDVSGVYPAGRLDFDSEGLLLLTDDKAFQHKISHPKFKLEKTYLAQVDGDIDEHSMEKLRRGVFIKGGKTLPAEVRKVDEPDWLWERSKPIRYRKNIPTSWVEIKISQGMNRQVRKMTAAVGFPTLRLIRTAIGGYELDGIGVGEFKEVKKIDN